MSIRELKEALAAHRVDWTGCTEKRELVELLEQSAGTSNSAADTDAFLVPLPLLPVPPKPANFREPEWGSRRAPQPHHHNVALAVNYEAEKDYDLRGFVATEKVDGIRAVWTPDSPNGAIFAGRNGNVSRPPKSLAALLPADMRLDGEIWAGRGNFDRVGELMGKHSYRGEVDHDWKHLKYIVFDAPAAGGGYLERLAAARARLAGVPADRVHVVQALPCEDVATKDALLQRVVDAGGEGLVLRRAAAPWRAGSTHRDLLKIKPWYDAEAVVLGSKLSHDSLCCRSLNQPDVQEQPSFDVAWVKQGRHFFDPEKQLYHPPAGTIITFKYQKGISTGQPRFPKLLRVHTSETCHCLPCTELRARRAGAA